MELDIDIMLGIVGIITSLFAITMTLWVLSLIRSATYSNDYDDTKESEEPNKIIEDAKKTEQTEQKTVKTDFDDDVAF